MSQHGAQEERPEASRGPDSHKEFGMTSYAVEHRTSIFMMFVIISLAGILSYRSIPKESFPEIEIPMIAINTIYPGVSPADIETLVTRPLEEELNTISEIDDLTSTSVEGYSSIIAEFQTSVNLDDALAKVREKVDLAKPDLPADAEEPSIIEFNFSEVPVMQVNLSGEYGLVRLKEIAEDLQDELEQLPLVLRADLRGGLEREVKVEADLVKLQYYNLTFNDLVDAIRAENVNIPGGAIDVGDRKYLVRVDGEFEDPAQIEDLVVTTVAGRAIYVRDVATVDFGFAERESFARLDGNPVVTLDVIKRSGVNIIETSETVREVLAEMEPTFPPTTVVKITSDMSEDIHEMVSSLENNIISGLLLIVAVLLFFLGLRTSLFVAVSIPTSMLLSFLVLKLVGVSMNMVVLFSLILALGMLVDNAIVVVENIYRYVTEGWDRKEAAKKATGEVAIPVIASTLTTLAAFGPMMFWPGMTGEFMKYLPLTLIVTLSSSLFVALVIVPTLCAAYLRLDDEPRKPLTREARLTIIAAVVLTGLLIAAANPLTALLLTVTGVALYFLHTRFLANAGVWFQNAFLPRLADRYESTLRWSLDHRVRVIGASVGVLILSFVVFGAFNQGVEFFPEDIPPAQVMVDIEAPVGTLAESTDRIAQRIERELPGIDGLMTDVKSVVTTTGSGGGGGNPMGGGPGGPNGSRITLSFVDFEERAHDGFALLAEMQAQLGRDLAGAEVSVDAPSEGSPQSGPPVNVELIGEEPAVLKELSDQMLRVLRNAPVYPKLVGLESDLDEARPELSLVVDREKAGLYGLSTFDVANAVRGAVQGIEAAKYRTGNDEYDIIVRLAPEYRDQLNSLDDLTIMAEGQQIPITSVARWTVGEGYGSIRRKNMDRMATISADVASGLNSNAVLAEVQQTLTDFDASLPPGYSMRYTGQNEDQQEAADFLGMAFLIALALIAFILISQFNSVVKPVIILTSVIMSVAGVLFGLVFFRMPFGIIMTGVGVISLAGIVVNNAIVLIDYVDILRDRDGMNRREALVQGGKTRLRPVLLTAITTALGLVPLAIGLNFDFIGLYTALRPDLFWGGEQAAWWGPMAIAVIAGILFATFLTLVLVPVMYSLVDDFTRFFQRHYVAKDEPAAAEPRSEPARPTPDRVPEPEPVGAFRSRLRPDPA
ncbi:MAG: efflux RND transporter permease subunit [Gemmatimonadota bacterium]|nr:efflux RND transporter permease subunit [Gemmatimonadota bacterium]